MWFDERLERIEERGMGHKQVKSQKKKIKLTTINKFFVEGIYVGYKNNVNKFYKLK